MTSMAAEIIRRDRPSTNYQALLMRYLEINLYEKHVSPLENAWMRLAALQHQMNHLQKPSRRHKILPYIPA